MRYGDVDHTVERNWRELSMKDGFTTTLHQSVRARGLENGAAKQRKKGATIQENEERLEGLQQAKDESVELQQNTHMKSNTRQKCIPQATPAALQTVVRRITNTEAETKRTQAAPNLHVHARRDVPNEKPLALFATKNAVVWRRPLSPPDSSFSRRACMVASSRASTRCAACTCLTAKKDDLVKRHIFTEICSHCRKRQKWWTHTNATSLGI